MLIRAGTLALFERIQGDRLTGMVGVGHLCQLVADGGPVDDGMAGAVFGPRCCGIRPLLGRWLMAHGEAGRMLPR